MTNQWVELVKVDAPSTSDTGAFNGISFTLSEPGFNQASQLGTFTLGWTDTNGSAPLNLPVTLDFIGVLKAGDAYAAYLFQGETLQSTPNSGGGTWQIAYTNNGNQIPTISHMTLYVRQGFSIGNPNPIPEPTGAGLLGLGLLALGAIRRRIA